MARHGSLADQLTTLLAYRSRPEIDEPIVPVKTNWTVVPANDNAAPEEIVDYGFERHLRITPSVEEIMRQAQTGPTVKNDAGQIISIGRLRFSDGGQTERAYTYGPEEKLIQYDAPMPVGAMLGTREKAEAQLGGKGYTSRQLEWSNYYFASVLDTQMPRYLPRTSKSNGKSYTADESRKILAEAYANTPVLPPVTYCEPGLPCGTQRMADCFVGMQKGKKGESGAISWEDIATSIVNREIWDATLAYLSENDTKTLDAAMEAKTMADLGDGGHKRGAALRSGRFSLIAANDNLREAMKLAS